MFWNGSTDMELIIKLKLTNILKFLDTTTKEERSDNSYELVLKDIN